MPEAASTWFLPRVVGISQAMEWVATGRVFAAEEALANLQQQLRQAAAPEKPVIERQIAAVIKTLGQLRQRQTALGCLMPASEVISPK